MFQLDSKTGGSIFVELVVSSDRYNAHNRRIEPFYLFRAVFEEMSTDLTFRRINGSFHEAAARLVGDVVVPLAASRMYKSNKNYQRHYFAAVVE